MNGTGKSTGYLIMDGVGRIIMFLFMMMFALAGVFFFWMMLQDKLKDHATRSWMPVECRIVDAKVDVVDDESYPYSPKVHYAYEFGGKAYTGSQFGADRPSKADYNSARKLIAGYSKGDLETCYVNAEDPAESVLNQMKVMGYLELFFPMIFITIGCVGVFFAVRGPRSSSKKRKRITRSSNALTYVGMFAFFSIFLGAGIATGWYLSIRTLVMQNRAKDWLEVPCVVLSGRILEYDGDDGNTYRVDILYEYQVDGEAYRSSQHGLIGGSSSGYGEKQAVLARYPAGKPAVCYVNPDDPWEAVLARTIMRKEWIWIFFPLPFFLVGLGGCIFVIKSCFFSGDSSAYGHSRLVRQGPVVLKTRNGPFIKFIWALFGALFWNGFVYGMIAALWDEFSGPDATFMKVFFGVFALAGLGLLASAVYFFIALFGPRVRLMISSPVLVPGKEFQVDWRISGRQTRLQDLKIDLEAEEWAIIRTGDKSSKHTKTLCSRNVVHLTDHRLMMQGSASEGVPARSMPSFKASRCGIKWVLKVVIRLRGLPDISQSYVVKVVPR